MPKPEIHPTWYPDAKVICNGEVVMTVGSTQPEISVDVWSGNHPFYTGTQKLLIPKVVLIASYVSTVCSILLAKQNLTLNPTPKISHFKTKYIPSSWF